MAQAHTITGTTNAGHDVTVTVTVTATPAKDYVTDGSFENAENDKNWTIAGTGASITEEQWQRRRRQACAEVLGIRCLRFLRHADHHRTRDWRICVLTAMSQGAAADNAAYYRWCGTLRHNGWLETTSDALELNGWVKFDTATVPVTVGADGTATITITGNLPADAWGNVDKVSLVKRPKLR